MAIEGVAGSAFLPTGGSVVLTTGYPLIFAPFFTPLSEASGRVVETVLAVPDDARVDRAELLVTAAPGSSAGVDASVPSVATVRPANPQVSDRTAVTLDFGALVTVGGLLLPALSAAIMATYAWTGSSWRFLTSSGAFSEVATERLLVEVAGATSAETLAVTMAGSAVVLPSLPAGLELLVDGTSVWFERQGSSTGVTTPAPPGGGVGYGVDRTAAVQEALAQARVVDGRRAVTVLLRATTPGRLTLTARTEVLRQHLVAFPPDGLTRTVDVAEEGRIEFDVTPPAGADEVREVALTLRGAFGPDRVTPPLGPDVEPDAVLVLAPDRPVLVGVPAALAGRLGTLSGLRVRLTTDAGGTGVEIAGRLLADADGRPAGPVAGGDLAPVQLPAGTSGWVTLPLAEPVAVVTSAADVALQCWLELIVAYGEAELALTTAPAPEPGAPVPTTTPALLAPGAPLLRRLPGGGTAAHTQVPALGTLNAALRLVGRPSPDRPLAAVALTVQRSVAAAEVTPTGDDLAVVLTLPTPFVTPADGPVTLTATAAAPGSLTLDRVRVAYTEVPEEGLP